MKFYVQANNFRQVDVICTTRLEASINNDIYLLCYIVSYLMAYIIYQNHPIPPFPTQVENVV